MEVIKGERKEIISYGLRFFYDTSGGFEFPCDENGKVLDNLNSAAKENYEWCMKNPQKFKGGFNEVKKYVTRYRELDTGVCDCCGETFELYNEYMGACECPKCGQWYNLFGQKLNPPETWSDGDDW